MQFISRWNFRFMAHLAMIHGHATVKSKERQVGTVSTPATSSEKGKVMNDAVDTTVAVEENQAPASAAPETVSKPKAKKKPAKKPAQKKGTKVKTAKKKSDNGEQKALPGHGSLKDGGTRLRVFRCLFKFPGLTQKQIKAKTGMPEVSGHLAVVLGEEIEKGRVKSEEKKNSEDRVVLTYKLTADGRKALDKGTVDGRVTGTKFGVEWSKARIKADK
jgi:hypothetical protein